MTRTKLLRGVLFAVVLLLAGGCTSSTQEGSTGHWVVIDRQSEASLTVRSSDGFKGSVTVSLDVSSEDSQKSSTATITSGNQVVDLKTKISHVGKLYVSVTVTGNNAGLDAIGDPVIKSDP